MINALSVFGQLMEFLPRTDIRAMVREHNSDRGCKGFTTFHHLSAMLFCQLGQVDSLRDIEKGLATASGKLSHLGLPKAPPRSTLSYANAHRSAAVFESLFYRLLSRADQIAGPGFRRKKSFRFKNQLLSMDGSTISLCLSLYPWAKFRRAKGGVKLHAVLDHREYLPIFAHITDAKTHEIRVARELSFPPDSVVVFDRGYTDYGWYGDLCAQGVFFVTRLKDNALYEVVRENSAPHGNILSDEVIRLTGVPGARCPHPLRRVAVRVEGRDEALVFLTNQMTFAPSPLRLIENRRHLQRTLADRAVFQGAQAKPQDQDLRGHQRKRAAHPDLDSSDRHPRPEADPMAHAGPLGAFNFVHRHQTQPLELS